MSAGGGRRVAITGVSGHWGSEIARRLARDPRVSYVVGIDTRPPAERRRRHRLHRGRPAERADLAPPSLDRGGHRRPLRDPLVSRARQAGSLAARLQRDRDAPAPRGVRADADARAGRRAWIGRDLRLRGSRAAVLPGGRWRARCLFGPAFSATSPSSRATSRTSPAATPRSRAACCASSRRSARTWTRRSSAT